MPTKRIEMAGRKFGKLTVLGDWVRVNGRIRWSCLCDCGNEKIIDGTNLRNGSSKSCGCQHKIKDRTGKRYGNLVAIKHVGSNQFGQMLWLCKCDCGNKKVVVGGALNHGDTKSCGCLHKLPKGKASFNAILKKIKKGAVRRGYKWNIPKEVLKELIIKDCFYCGNKPSNVQKNHSHNGAFMYNGLDRVDNNKGYTIDNIVPCCWDCNRAKYTMNVGEFFLWIKRIVDHNKLEWGENGISV